MKGKRLQVVLEELLAHERFAHSASRVELIQTIRAFFVEMSGLRARIRDLETGDSSGKIRTMADVEREHIMYVISQTDGVPAAAKILGISDSTLYRKLEAWGERTPSVETRHRRSSANMRPQGAVA